MSASTDCWMLSLKEGELYRPLIVVYRLLEAVVRGLDCFEAIYPSPNFLGQCLFFALFSLDYDHETYAGLMVRRVSRKKLESLDNEVVFSLNVADVDSLNAGVKKTLILFGMPRGGTTMIANVVRSMGVYLGEELPVNLEDGDFNWDILGRKNPEWTREHKIASIRQAIESRNQKFDTWGWKYPRIDLYLKDICSQVVNPMFVCVFRDVVASTWRGVVRRGRPAAGAIRYALELQANQLALLEEAGAPALLVSYEKAIDDPLQLAVSLNQFMGLGFSRKELKEHAKRVDAQMGYKASEM